MSQICIDPPIFEETTNDIKIAVQPEFRMQESDPFIRRYTFAYHIEIENIGSESAQLLERHWKVYSAGVLIGDIMGPGVVGEQPIIQPRSMYKYSSGTEIKDPVGYMEGVYTFKSVSRNLFLVKIPRFQLLYPMAIN